MDPYSLWMLINNMKKDINALKEKPFGLFGDGRCFIHFGKLNSCDFIGVNALSHVFKLINP